MDQSKSPYEHDMDLEAKAKEVGAYEVRPLVTRLHEKVGMFNFIRNAKNKREVEVKHADEMGQ